MRKQIYLISTALLLTVLSAYGQSENQNYIYRKCYVGSSLFMSGNLNYNDSPDFYQLNYGYRITPKHVISIEAITWKYSKSLGIPYGKSYSDPAEKFPGHIREYGIALAYQHFWWKGLYTAIHILNAGQIYLDNNGNKIKNGYQMFNTYRLGYQIKLFKNMFFIEPSISITHRPIQTKMPDSFAQLNDKWPKYFLGEPGLHFGFNF